MAPSPDCTIKGNVNRSGECIYHTPASRWYAKIQMKMIGDAVDMFKMQHKKLPDGLEALTQTTDQNPEPYLDKVPKDPWENEYEYRTEGNKKYQLRSVGEDGQPDTSDDIWWPEKSQ